MTFNLDPVADQAASEGQPDQQPATPDQEGGGADNGITPTNIDEILKKNEHAQRHISTLEDENKLVRENFATMQERLAELEGQLMSQQKLQELLTGKNTSNDQQGSQEENNLSTPTTPLDPNMIDSIVAQRIEGYMTEKAQEVNFKAAQQSLNEIFKDKADDHVAKVAQENMLSTKDAMALAKSNPTLFNNLFVNPFKKNNTSFSPTKGNESTSSVPNQTTEITMEHWNKLRRENPQKYFAASTQKEFHKWFHENKN